MNRELLIKLLTGVFAKLIRYALTAAGGTAAINGINGAGGPEGQPVHLEQLAAGAATIAVAIGWSLWEDHIKKTTNQNETTLPVPDAPPAHPADPPRPPQPG